MGGFGGAVDLDGGDAVHKVVTDRVAVGGCGRNVIFLTIVNLNHRGREGGLVVHKHTVGGTVGVLLEDAPCDGVALGGFDGHAAAIEPSISVIVTFDVVQRHSDDAVGRLAVGGHGWWP